MSAPTTEPKLFSAKALSQLSEIIAPRADKIIAASIAVEPVRLTRASMIGLRYRIATVYGSTPIGVRTFLRYERALGCRDSILEEMVAGSAKLRPFDNITGARPTLRVFSQAERSRRERWAREDRAEVAHG